MLSTDKIFTSILIKEDDITQTIEQNIRKKEAKKESRIQKSTCDINTILTHYTKKWPTYQYPKTTAIRFKNPALCCCYQYCETEILHQCIITNMFPDSSTKTTMKYWAFWLGVWSKKMTELEPLRIDQYKLLSYFQIRLYFECSK